MNGNLGETGLRQRKRSDDPMRAFDALPTPLRRWLCDASLPWSPSSARRLWQKARAQGLSVEQTLEALSQAEARKLDRVAQLATKG